MLHSPLYVLLTAVIVFLLWIVWRRLAGMRCRVRHKFSARASAEGARAAPRFPVQWSVAIETRGGMRQGITRNVSRGGMFVEMDPPLELGQTYPMTIEVSGRSTMQIEACVAWSITGGTSGHDAVSGMGVMFTDISEGDLTLVATFEHSSEDAA